MCPNKINKSVSICKFEVAIMSRLIVLKYVCLNDDDMFYLMLPIIKKFLTILFFINQEEIYLKYIDDVSILYYNDPIIL